MAGGGSQASECYKDPSDDNGQVSGNHSIKVCFLNKNKTMKKKHSFDEHKNIYFKEDKEQWLAGHSGKEAIKLKI